MTPDTSPAIVGAQTRDADARGCPRGVVVVIVVVIAGCSVYSRRGSGSAPPPLGREEQAADTRSVRQLQVLSLHVTRLTPGAQPAGGRCGTNEWESVPLLRRRPLTPGPLKVRVDVLDKKRDGASQSASGLGVLRVSGCGALIV